MSMVNRPLLPRPPSSVKDHHGYLTLLAQSLNRELVYSQRGRGILRFENLVPSVSPAGEKNGSNQIFTVPGTMATDALNVPLSALFWKDHFLDYTLSQTPGGGEWTIKRGASQSDDSTTIIVGDAPLAGDGLLFPLLIVI